ncbi:class I mannose-6-phosphate isomerase [Flavobacterium sp. CBA20B-1]|uniref:type I phosphomannose isomerase catalytic subunit n=1 Tax=unclassified Flavobacterium TaxID=196869 RepID=UPI0022252A36|nr:MULTISPECIES: type I phosphomannose isomerase catalytic subunit [unclassified Flavobacterium]WCM42142.1 class I mannose-6-phosphate isomerase [Flavobacterium sp. CBA20B-1]
MNSTPKHINKHNLQSKFKSYPLYFQPILKERIWGGEKLKALGKKIPSKNIGESWEISMIDTDVNVVTNGIYQEKNLAELIHLYPNEILGTKVYQKYGTQFPLLFKFLDAKTDLSIQLHPNDELAKKRHNSFGKTEMWYIMQADDDARIILGFKKDSSPEEYIQHLQNKTLPNVLQEYYVQKGDVFFIETGTIHAIGGGILLAEIQQTSDITYRVYDWDRVDDQGNERELHVDLALEAINYKNKDPKIQYQKKENEAINLVDCPFFTTKIVSLTSLYEVAKNSDCFLVYICTEGSAQLTANNETFQVQQGTTILVPAQLTNFAFTGNATLLEVFINEI